MPQWLADMIPAGMEQIVSWLVAATIVIALVFVVLTIAKKAMGGSTGPRGKGRGPRLAIMDVTAIDTKRKLVLVRRDEIEHLLLIGGQNDLVVEPGILRVPASARTQRTEPTMRPEPEAGIAERTPPSPAATAAPVADARPAIPVAPPSVAVAPTPVAVPAVAAAAAVTVAAPRRPEPDAFRPTTPVPAERLAPPVPAERLAPSAPSRQPEARATSPLTRPVPRAPSAADPSAVAPAVSPPSPHGPSIQGAAPRGPSAQSPSTAAPAAQVPSPASVAGQDRAPSAAANTPSGTSAPTPSQPSSASEFPVDQQAAASQRPAAGTAGVSSNGFAPEVSSNGRTAGEALASAMLGGASRNAPTVVPGENIAPPRPAQGDERQTDEASRPAAPGAGPRAGGALPVAGPSPAIFPTAPRADMPTSSQPTSSQSTSSQPAAPQPAALQPPAPQPPAARIAEPDRLEGAPRSAPVTSTGEAGPMSRPVAAQPGTSAATTSPEPERLASRQPVSPLPGQSFGSPSQQTAPSAGPSSSGAAPSGPAASGFAPFTPRSMATPTIPARPPESPTGATPQAGQDSPFPRPEEPKRIDSSPTVAVPVQQRVAPPSGPTQGFSLGGYMPGAFAPGGASVPAFPSMSPARPQAPTSPVIAAAERQRETIRQRAAEPARDDGQARRTEPQPASPAMSPAGRPARAEDDEVEKKPLSVRSFATSIQSMKPSFEPSAVAPSPVAASPVVTAPAALPPERSGAPQTPAAPVVSPAVGAPAAAVSVPAPAPAPARAAEVRSPIQDQGDTLEDFLSAELDSDFGNVRWDDDAQSSAAPEVRAESAKVPEVKQPGGPSEPRALTLEEEMERLLGDFDFEVSDRRTK